jgi:hypothetical protein
MELRIIGLSPGSLAACWRLLRRRHRRIALRQRRAQRVEAWGAWEPVFFDGAPDCRHHCGVLVLGKINCRHGSDVIGRNGAISNALRRRGITRSPWALVSESDGGTRLSFPSTDPGREVCQPNAVVGLCHMRASLPARRPVLGLGPCAGSRWSSRTPLPRSSPTVSSIYHVCYALVMTTHFALMVSLPLKLDRRALAGLRAGGAIPPGLTDDVGRTRSVFKWRCAIAACEPPWHVIISGLASGEFRAMIAIAITPSMADCSGASSGLQPSMTSVSMRVRAKSLRPLEPFNGLAALRVLLLSFLFLSLVGLLAEQL